MWQWFAANGAWILAVSAIVLLLLLILSGLIRRILEKGVSKEKYSRTKE